MKVVGLDLSLTATGIAHADGALTTLKPASTGMVRLNEIVGTIEDATAGALLVVLEGYSLGSRDSHAHALGELGGVVRLMLHNNGTPYVDVAPTRLKKWATGRGNADKDAVLVKAVRRFDPSPENNNEADAAWLRDMGLARVVADRALTPAQTEILAAIDWPEITAPSAPVPWG